MSNIEITKDYVYLFVGAYDHADIDTYFKSDYLLCEEEATPIPTDLIEVHGGLLGALKYYCLENGCGNVKVIKIPVDFWRKTDNGIIKTPTKPILTSLNTEEWDTVTPIGKITHFLIAGVYFDATGEYVENEEYTTNYNPEGMYFMPGQYPQLGKNDGKPSRTSRFR